MQSSDRAGGQERRFLVEVRGMLRIDAPNSAAAQAAAEKWIVATGKNEPADLPPGVQVWWLRIEPESEENIGWPPVPPA